MHVKGSFAEDWSVKAMPNKIALFTPAWLDACALYRMFLPHLYLKSSRFVFNPRGLSIHEFTGVDVIVVQRQATDANEKALKQFIDLGFKLIYDLDDNLWNLPSANPAAKIFEQMRPGFGRCARLCHAITVSTESLATAVRTAVPEFSKEIVVIPNAVDENLFRKINLPKDESKFVVGWGGSNTHAGDIREVWEILPDLLEELPNLYLEFIGHGPPKKIENHPRVKIRQFVPVAEYFARYTSWAWDVVLAPLDDNRFNRSKSALKMIEATTIGAVCLGSPVEPYNRFVDHDAELKYVLCRKQSIWKDRIRELYYDREKHKYYADRMRKVTEEHYAIQKVKDQWNSLIQSL